MWTIRKIEDWSEPARFMANQLEVGDWVWIEGEMGVGKTHLVREILRELGYTKPVPSPSYPLMLTYELDSFDLVHIDGFRMSLEDEAPWDVELLEESLLFVEWPGNTNLPLEKFNTRVEIHQAEDGLRTLKLFQNSQEVRDLN